MKYFNSKQTLEEIRNFISQEKSGAYLRFGDGDVNLANGVNDSYQMSNEILKNEMAEVLSSERKGVLKALPLNCREYGGWEVGMFPGNHECSKEWADNLLDKCEKFWDVRNSNIYSATALHYLATQDVDYVIDFLCFLKNIKNKIFVGNENVPEEIKNIVFGENCCHIKTPSSNSFGKIDEIENNFEKKMQEHNENEFFLVFVSMGCSGRILEKRLLDKFQNIFLFDFGSLLDALCGWNTRAWIELTNFDKKVFLEKIIRHEFK